MRTRAHAGVNTPVGDFSKIIPEASERDMPHTFQLRILSQEEWVLLIAATEAYKHNTRYQALHAKLLTQQLLAQNALPPQIL